LRRWRDKPNPWPAPAGGSCRARKITTGSARRTAVRLRQCTLTRKKWNTGKSPFEIADKSAVKDRVISGLAKSIADIGLMNPIWVSPIKEERDRTQGYRLVSGRNRVAAATKLGWQKIDARIVELDDLHTELATIDENLIRGKLTPAQRAIVVPRRKEIYLALHPETRNGATGRSRGKLRQNGEAKRFTKDAAESTGQSERVLQRDAERGNAIPDIDKVVGTSLDKGTELDALAKLPKEVQAPLIERAAAGETVSAVEAKTAVIYAPRKSREFYAILKEGRDLLGAMSFNDLKLAVAAIRAVVAKLVEPEPEPELALAA
jgi:ParB/RepB/Spo0J family partition protein